MAIKLDLVGRVFGRLTVLSEGERKAGMRQFVCLCICGERKTVSRVCLTKHKTTSCGCYRREVTGRLKRSHNGRKLHRAAYSRWQNMRRRCFDQNHKDYADYGGRGISVCDRWLQFENFIADMGDPPAGMTLERSDNSVSYSLSNCVWANLATQARNRRSCHVIEIDGERMVLADWALRVGTHAATISDRIQRGWSEADAVLVPSGCKRPYQR